jgi:hypothetical protein
MSLIYCFQFMFLNGAFLIKNPPLALSQIKYLRLTFWMNFFYWAFFILFSRFLGLIWVWKILRMFWWGKFHNHILVVTICSFLSVSFAVSVLSIVIASAISWSSEVSVPDSCSLLYSLSLSFSSFSSSFSTVSMCSSFARTISVLIYSWLW